METAAAASAPNARKKRSRLRLSCKQCRERKRKCNRLQPCDHCSRQNLPCEFVPYDEELSLPARPRGAGRTGQNPGTEYMAELQRRLRYLEQLVTVLRSQSKDEAGKDAPKEAYSTSVAPTISERAFASAPAAPPSDVRSDESSRDSLSPQPRRPEPAETNSAGIMLSKDQNQRHVYDASWEAIMDEIAQLTEDLRTAEDGEEEPMDPPVQQDGVALLTGSYPIASEEEIRSYLPRRVLADRLLAKFFQSLEPAYMIFHPPSFLREYNKFWESPHTCSLSWLGLLYILFSTGCAHYDEEEDFEELGSSRQVHEGFRIAFARCYRMADYTVPGKWKLEALFVNFGVEYVRQVRFDFPNSTTFLWSGFVSLAMHMGYHRDPRHFKHLTPFEGEMRRRMWLQIIEADAVISYIYGLPPRVDARFYDTDSPRNLHDDDFNESTTELPPSRPLTEMTRVAYTITSCKLITVFNRVMAAVQDKTGASYADVMQLDHDLQEVRDSMPHIFRLKPLHQALTDPVLLLIQRYLLEALYLRARIVLHRKYLSLSRTNPRFTYSRFVSVDAAMKLLLIQHEMHVQSQKGGLLKDSAWAILRQTTDFLLAAMILSLELSYLRASQRASEGAVAEGQQVLAQTTHGADNSSGGRGEIYTIDQLLEALRVSRYIWQTAHNQSAEAGRAYKTISKMLSASTGEHFESSSNSTDEGPGTDDVQSVISNYNYPNMAPHVANVLPNRTGGATQPGVQLLPVDADTLGSLQPPPASIASWQSDFVLPAGIGNSPMGLTSLGASSSRSPDQGSMFSRMGSGFDVPANLQVVDWSMLDDQIRQTGIDIDFSNWNPTFQG